MVFLEITSRFVVRLERIPEFDGWVASPVTVFARKGVPGVPQPLSDPGAFFLQRVQVRPSR